MNLALDPARYADVRVCLDEGVGTVTLDRPPTNALAPTTMLEICDAIARLAQSDDVRAIVLTGAGRFFSSGADLARDGLFDAETGLVDRGRIRAIRARFRQENDMRSCDLLELPVPVIAAVNGSAAGGGLTLTLQADIRIVAADARFSFAFVRRGLSAEHGATWLLPRLIGHGAAMELLLTGRRFDGAEAAQLGLASAAVPASEVLSRAVDIARTIATECSPLAVAVMKRMAWAHGSEPSYVTVTRREKDVIEWITAQRDAPAGIRAFTTRQAPQFASTGRERLPNFVPSLFETVVEEY